MVPQTSEASGQLCRPVGSSGRLAASSSFSKFCIEDDDEDEDDDEGATAPFIAPPTRRLKPHWTPPSPAVGENARRYVSLSTDKDRDEDRDKDQAEPASFL